MTVAAIDQAGSLASFSNYGSTSVDIVGTGQEHHLDRTGPVRIRLGLGRHLDGRPACVAASRRSFSAS